MATNKTVKLTPTLLRRIIEEEVEKGFGAEEPTEDAPKDTEEVDADEYGTDKSLDKHIDYMKALKIEERRLARRLAKVQEAKKRTVAALIKKI